VALGYRLLPGDAHGAGTRAAWEEKSATTRPPPLSHPVRCCPYHRPPTTRWWSGTGGSTATVCRRSLSPASPGSPARPADPADTRSRATRHRPPPPGIGHRHSPRGTGTGTGIGHLAPGSATRHPPLTTRHPARPPPVSGIRYPPPPSRGRRLGRRVVVPGGGRRRVGDGRGDGRRGRHDAGSLTCASFWQGRWAPGASTT